MIGEKIASGKYIDPSDTTFMDLKRFQDILYRNFKGKNCYDDMFPVSNQPTRFFATAKTHKFNTIEEINDENLKLRSVIDQTITYIYNA